MGCAISSIGAGRTVHEPIRGPSLTYWREVEASPSGNKTSGSADPSRSEKQQQSLDKLLSLWPNFFASCRATAVEAVSQGLMLPSDVLSLDFTFTPCSSTLPHMSIAIPSLAVTDMLLESQALKHGLLIDGRELSQNRVAPEVIGLFLELNQIKRRMAGFQLSDLARVTLRRFSTSSSSPSSSYSSSSVALQPPPHITPFTENNSNHQPLHPELFRLLLSPDRSDTWGHWMDALTAATDVRDEVHANALKQQLLFLANDCFALVKRFAVAPQFWKCMWRAFKGLAVELPIGDCRVLNLESGPNMGIFGATSEAGRHDAAVCSGKSTLFPGQRGSDDEPRYRRGSQDLQYMTAGQVSPPVLASPTHQMGKFFPGLANDSSPLGKPLEPPYDEFSQTLHTGERFRWHFGRRVGQGAFGKVYKAWDADQRMVVAVKEVCRIGDSPEEFQRVEREIAIMTGLRHPHIVPLVGSEKSVEHGSNGILIFMEFASGGSLAEHVMKTKKLSEDEAGWCLEQVVHGLAYLHSNRIIHRDVKSANCLRFPLDPFASMAWSSSSASSSSGACCRSKQGSAVHGKSCSISARKVFRNGNVTAPRYTVKLADFGSSKKLRSIFTDTGEIQTVEGTANWMAPEVLLGDGVGRSSDVWSLGGLALELLTGYAPWVQPGKEKMQQVTLMYKIAKTDQIPPIPSDLSPHASSFTALCLQRDQTLRPTSHELTSHPWFAATGGG